jgi:hypothetical protein
MSVVDCSEIRDAFRRGTRLEGPEIERHIAKCAPCRQLLAEPELGRALSAHSTELPVLDPRLEAQLRATLAAERGVRATLRALPTPARIGLALFGAALLVAYPLLAGRPGSVEPTLLVPLALSLLLITAALLGTARARAPWQSRALLALGAALPALLWLARGESAEPAGNALVCFAYGSLFSLPLLSLFVVLERRDRLPPADAALLGASLGLFAAIILELECASRHLPHLLAGHASVGWAFIALLVGLRQLRAR